LQGLRFGMPQDSFVSPLHPEVRSAWRAALRVLEEEGAEIVDVELPRPSMELYRTIQKPEATLAHTQKGWFPAQLDSYGETVRTRLLEGEAITAVAYLSAQSERRIFSSSLRSIMQRVDAFILPTLPITAPLLEQTAQDIEIDGVTENATTALLRLTMPFNLSGLPAVSCPCGFASNGLPIGLQIAGKPFEEATVLRIAYAYQQLTDWHYKEAQPANAQQ
jgi:aspartyl-tRNA(Asn)/glutamyl-tRNA(Gln) amidotransferase subunit A